MDNKNNVIKTVYRIVITVITIGCIIAGTVMHAGGWFNNTGKFWKRFNWKSSGTKNAGEQDEIEENLDSFDSIDISVNIGDITIKEGSSYSIYYEYPEEWEPKYSISEGKLTVSNDASGTFDLGPEDYDCELIITVQKGTELDNVKIENDMGDICINDADITTAEMSLSMGDVEIHDCKIEDLTADNSMGDIEVSDTASKEAKLTLSMGDVTFSGEADSININCSMGSIEVNTDSDWKGTLETDMGSVTVNGTDQGDRYSR